mmetsp:Transcript_95616/g.270569  ORF Transcript_95616/g.270569 Transcript_95616/m.270569 type:complete len:89 (-) Transcript_95616:63-329(-)
MCCYVLGIPIFALYTWLAAFYFRATGRQGDPRTAAEDLMDGSPMLTAMVAALLVGALISGTGLVIWNCCVAMRTVPPGARRVAGEKEE